MSSPGRPTYHRWVVNGVGTTDRDERDRLAYPVAIFLRRCVLSCAGGGLVAFEWDGENLTTIA